MVEKLKQNIKNILMSQGMFLSFEKREVLDLELRDFLLHVHVHVCKYKKKKIGWAEEYIGIHVGIEEMFMVLKDHIG